MEKQSVYGGLFSDPPLISTDAEPKNTDPYDKMEPIPSRYLGKGMGTQRGLTGRTPDVYFEKKFLTLASFEQNGNNKADSVVDTKKHRRRKETESKKFFISSKVFLPPSYPKMSDGPGSYSGCFQSRPYEPPPPTENSPRNRQERRQAKAAALAAQKQAALDRTKTSLPNIKTNPPKKGTYGVPGTLLDNPKYNDNWLKEYEEWEAAKRKKDKNKVEPKEISLPFKIPGTTRNYLDELPATGVSSVYTYVPLEEKARKKKKRHKHIPAAAVFEQEKPMFFEAAKSGEDGCFSKFLNTWIDPKVMEEAKNKKKKKNRKHNVEYIPGPPKGTSGFWKPNSPPETSVVQSCLRRFY